MVVGPYEIGIEDHDACSGDRGSGAPDRAFLAREEAASYEREDAEVEEVGSEEGREGVI